MYSLKTFKAENATDAYKQLAEAIDVHGQIISARNEETKELLNVSVEILDPRHRIIPISQFKLPFILQETFDILNSNDPRVIHSKQMLEKTMGNSSDPMFFGNELRQAFSRWSLKKLVDRFVKDKNTRKAVLDLGNRRNGKHTPCMIFAHFIIRDNKLFMTAETRGTALSMGFTNDIFFLTLMQEIVLGLIKEHYPEVEMGTFLYKTVSLHEYIEKPEGRGSILPYEYVWNQSILIDPEYHIEEFPITYREINLNYKQFIQDMGVLYHYVDTYMKASESDDIDSGKYIKYSDCMQPDPNLFNSPFFYEWANILYKNIIK
jgi:hypothetical protein